MFAQEFRPKTLSEFIGNAHVVSALTKYLKDGSLPSTLRFEGQAGTGKTTLARIIGNSLEAQVVEHDCGADGDINKIRQIVEQSEFSSLFHSKKVIILDEVQKLSKAAQQVLLKSTEEPAKGTYFIMCTTDPQDLIPALRSRGVSFKLEPVKVEGVRDIYRKLKDTYRIEFEGKQEDWYRIVDASEGSLRIAYNILDKVVAAGEVKPSGEIYVSSDMLSKLLGFVDDNEEMEEGMPLPQAFLKKDLSGALDAVQAAKKDKKEPMPTLIGLYNYLKKARLKASKNVLIDIAEILSQPERANTWYSVEYIILKHL